ncbi:MAG: hypothetical protein JWM57_1592 [Phycisphaerales bacterium]|nr:hypothetical protein [Phycisphaerales bacterium]
MTQTAPTIEATEPTGSDRRRSPRSRRETTAWLSAASGQRNGNGFNVRVRDLSLHGVGYVAEKEPRQNDTHWMVIADQSLRLSTRLRVVSTRQREDGHWDVGGEFF